MYGDFKYDILSHLVGLDETKYIWSGRIKLILIHARLNGGCWHVTFAKTILRLICGVYQYKTIYLNLTTWRKYLFMDLHLSNNQNVKACLISRKMLHFIFRFGQGNIFWKSSWYIMIIILHLANHDKIVLPHIAQLHHHQVLGDGDHAVHLHARQVCVPSGTCQEGNMFHMISYKCFHI